jgi:acyl carrier protein
VPAGVPGELYIGGDGLSRGYLGRPELTAERFVPDPFSVSGGTRLYRTGDRARYLRDGQIEFLGRLDYQVKVRGHRIELGEVEAALGAHERVRQCLVVVREEEDGDRRLVAYVVAEGAVGHDELREHIRRGLPEYMVPSLFVSLDEVPLTPNGKIDRKRLPAPSLSEESESYVAPRTETERAAADIWSQVLRVARVGVDDNFFALGGHSLLGMQLVSRVCEVFDIELPLHVLFRASVLSEFAEAIETAREQKKHRAPSIISRAARRAATASPTA